MTILLISLYFLISAYMTEEVKRETIRRLPTAGLPHNRVRFYISLTLMFLFGPILLFGCMMAVVFKGIYKHGS